MNPFKLIPGLYEPANITKYQNADTSRGFPTDVPPHTYAVAQTAMDMLRITKENQACVVSGKFSAYLHLPRHAQIIHNVYLPAHVYLDIPVFVYVGGTDIRHVTQRTPGDTCGWGRDCT